MKIAIFTFFFSIQTTIAQTLLLTIPDKPEVIFVKGGSFQMGNNEEVHHVTVGDFSIGKYPVIVRQYRKFCEAVGRQMSDTPVWGWDDSHPVVNVSHDDAVSYCNWLSEKYGGNWRLPTEAEWEYAARGGNKSCGYKYSGSDDLNSVGWFIDNSGAQIMHRVGGKKPNELGLYDMSGSVLEWCGDWYGEDYYADSPSDNPKGPESGFFRIRRGGSWRSGDSQCWITNRHYGDPKGEFHHNGFRVVFVP